MIDSLKNICSSIFKIITNKFKKLKKTQKIIILILLVILTIITVAFVYNVGTETSNNTDDFKTVKVETNNGYKTFDFTVDDILKAYSIDINSIYSYSNSPYCIENKGTSRIEFTPNRETLIEQYINIGIIYEDISRKVIMYETFMNEFDILRLKKDLDISDGKVLSESVGEIIVKGSNSILYRIGHKITLSNGMAKLLKDKETGNIQGEYKLYNEVGSIMVSDIGTKDCKYDCRYNVIAINGEEFLNLSVNSLTDSSLYNNWLVKEDDIEEKDNRIKDNITGIEQAIKDGAFEVTDDLSESKLKAAFIDGNLQLYYDNWEKCLEDAQKLNIITSNKPYLTMEEELEQQYYNEQNYNNYSYNKEDNSVSNEQPILVKSYNTIKKEDSSDYHIIKIYEYSNGEYSYETDLCTYGSITPSIISDRRYKTLDEALTSAIQNFKEFSLTISDLTEE